MKPTDTSLIRNFSIIAHIDHGKSTLSDRIIQHCGGLEDREMKEQVLDNMDIERERGITIKSQTVRLKYKSPKDGKEYLLNLMDTPGHVDFGYEVSRCLAACEGSLLLVDTTQGVEAQTIANVYKAMNENHEIIPVLNKADLPSSDPDKTKQEIEQVIGLNAEDGILASGKTGVGVPDILEAVVERIPAPKGDPGATLKAMLIDAWYDVYLGVVMLVRVIDGKIAKGDRVKMMFSGAIRELENVGVFTPKKTYVPSLSAGEVGFICANVKQVADVFVGDTIVAERDTTTVALTGFKKVQPVVFCGLYPVESDDYEQLKEAIEKLALNDSSIEFGVETSSALGFGFRCGFLGLLHMEVIQERLEREFDVDLVTTAPSVVYHITMNDGEILEVHNPAEMPDPVKIDHIDEPIVSITILSPEAHLGEIIKLCTEKRGIQKTINFSAGGRVIVDYYVPLSEIVFDFHDKLKSVTSGYASFEWEMHEYKRSDIVKVQVLVNGDPVDALSLLTHRSKAQSRGRMLCEKLKELIPRQMFAVPIQAAIGGKIIARETIAALRKDVTAKCYGGDVSRKRKLLDKQKKGKKKMKMLGSVSIPQSAFLAVLKLDD